MKKRPGLEKILPKQVKDELIAILRTGKMTQLQLIPWLKDKGFDASKSSINRLCIKLKSEYNRLINVGIKPSDFKKHKAHIEILAWKLLEREILNKKSQDIENKIAELKAKIPFFNRGGNND